MYLNSYGRAEELQRLLAELRPGKTHTLCGPGGIGKTALAAEAIWELAPDNQAPERFPDGILFHSFYNQPSADLALEGIARAYGVEPKPKGRVGIERQDRPTLPGRRRGRRRPGQGAGGSPGVAASWSPAAGSRTPPIRAGTCNPCRPPLPSRCSGPGVATRPTTKTGL